MKLGYSIGDFGANLAFQTTGFYLMYFFTDVFGIVPALAGGIFLYAKLWDAVTDPIMGAIADHTESRWGSSGPTCSSGRSLWESRWRCFSSRRTSHLA